MIDDRALPLVASLWPTFRGAAGRYRLEPRLLLALAYVQSGLDAARSASGALGLLQMTAATAAEVAQRLHLTTYDLTDPPTAVELGAAHLKSLIDRFGSPREGIAAYVAGPAAVREAGGKVPDDRNVQRIVRDVMLVWQWLTRNFDDVMDASAASSTVTSATSTVVLPAASTSTTAGSAPAILTAPQWRLVSPPDNWKSPISVDTSTVSVLEELATRLHLAFSRDDERRKVYVGVPRETPKTAPGRLVLPVPGATAANNAAYPVDTGLDVAVPVGTPVVAAGSGRVVYSEWGHTPWTDPPDTPGSVLVALDTPFAYKGQAYGYTWYAHLSRLRFAVPDGSNAGPHVEQGDLIGWTGIGNRVPHLHFGVVQDRAQTVFVPPTALAAYFGWVR